MIVNFVLSKLEIKYESYIFQMHAICNYFSVSIYHFDLERRKNVLISSYFDQIHAGRESPQLAMTGASCGFSRVGAQL